MQCDICQNSIEAHPAVFAAVLDLEGSGQLPPGAYNSIVVRMCEMAGCASE